jgi:ribonuclease D
LYKILGNAVLMRVAVGMPSNKKQLAEIGGLSRKQMTMYGDGLVRVVKRTKNLPGKALPVYPHCRAQPKRDGMSLRMRALKSWRKGKSQSLQLDPALICSNALAGAIADLHPKELSDFGRVSGMRQWQIQEFGDEIITILHDESR